MESLDQLEVSTTAESFPTTLLAGQVSAFSHRWVPVVCRRGTRTSTAASWSTWGCCRPGAPSLCRAISITRSKKSSRITRLIKCLNILDGDILIETKSSNGLASKLNLADTNYDIKFSLADPAVIPKVPQINDSDQPSASFEMTDEFITRFVKSKDALNDLPSFTIETKEGMTGNDLVFTIGTDITNTIQFSVDELHEVTEEFEQIPFDSNLFKEILKANRNYESGTVHINKKGLIQLTFNYNDGFNTHYYLVRLQENN